MSKWAFFFILILIAVGLFDRRYAIDDTAPKHQYVLSANGQRWIHVNIDALHQAPDPPAPPTNPKQPDCYPGVVCGCQFIFHCTNENPMAFSQRAIVWRMEANLALL